MPLAAVFAQKGDQPAGTLDIQGIKDISPNPPGPQQSGALQLGEVMRQRRRRQPDLVGDLARGKAVGTPRNEQPKHPQAMLVSQRCQRFDRFFHFHTLTIRKISNRVNPELSRA
jgi:hypothetical protein